MFPLYDELYELTNPSLVQDDITTLNWSNASTRIACLTEEQMEILYILILSHYLKENKLLPKKKRFVPYKGKLMDSNHGVLFNINNIPNRLQHIISAYLNLIL